MPIRGIDAYCHRSTGNDLFNLRAAGSFSHSEWPIVSCFSGALLINCLVGVSTLGSVSMIFDPLKSSHSISSVATLISIRLSSSTVNQLLLTQIYGIWLVLELDLITFVSGSCGKSPARSALALILDTSNHSFSSPINFSCETSIDWLFSSIARRHTSFSEIRSDELFLSEVGKLVDSHFPGVAQVSVMSLDAEEVLCEDGAAVGELFSFGDGFAELAKEADVFEGICVLGLCGFEGVEDCCGYQEQGNRQVRLIHGIGLFINQLV